MTRLRRTLAALVATVGKRQVLLVGVVGVIYVVCVVSTNAQQALFRSQVDAVVLDVLPTDRNGVISGLRAEDFEVRDNGVLQTLTHVSGDVAPLGVVLLLDTSGSLSLRELDHLRRGALEIAGTLRDQDEMRLVTFSHHVRLHGLVDSGALTQIFSMLEPLGETALHDALAAAFRFADRQDQKRPVVIAFSDGADTASWLSATHVTDAARGSWAAFFGATPRVGATPIFDDLAAITGGATLALDADFANLPKTFLQLLGRVRQRYLLAFTPSSNVPGWHELEVRVKRPGARVVARQGYLRR